MAAVVRWKFDDLTTLATYTFEINPASGGSPSFEKNLVYENTLAPNGHALIYEGQDPVRELTWEGVILTQTHYQTYVDWWDKRHQIKLTDDLGRQYVIYIKSFQPKRERAVHYPWKHSYTVTAVILDWLSEPTI